MRPPFDSLIFVYFDLFFLFMTITARTITAVKTRIYGLAPRRKTARFLKN